MTTAGPGFRHQGGLARDQPEASLLEAQVVADALDAIHLTRNRERTVDLFRVLQRHGVRSSIEARHGVSA